MSRNEKKVNKKQVTKIVKSLMAADEEVKQFQVYSAGNAFYCGTGYYQSALLGISQGDANNNRTGDNVYLKSIDLHLLIENGVGATANSYTNSRVVVYQYFGLTAVAAPVPSTYLWLGSALNAGGVTGTHSAYNSNLEATYRVIYDQTVTTSGSFGLAVTGNGGASGHVKAWHVRVPMGKVQKKIQYSSGGVNTANGLYIVCTSDMGTIATNPKFGFDADVRFTNL